MRTLGLVSRIAFVALAACPAAASQGAPNYKKEKEIVLPGAPGFDYVFVDSEAKRLYAAHGGAVDVVDLDKGAKIGEVADVQGAHGIAVAPKLKRGFATAGRKDRLIVFDLETLKVTNEIETGKNPDAILFVPALNEVWSFNGRGRNVTCVDAASLKVTATIPLEGKPEFGVDWPSKGKVFVNIEDKSTVVAIDAKEHKVAASYALVPCEEPTGLAIDAETGTLFAGCKKKLAAVDAATGKVLKTPEIGDGCDATAFDPETKAVFASCGDGTTMVLRKAANGDYESAKIETLHGARTCTVDPKTHKLYVASGPARGAKGDLVILVFAPAPSK